ncbi:TIGR02611 family protein [Actinomadura decatromicini]|uniref:TIGR02611 family protein n=1 Tax=Actinomadura decatromicini TaxID=2604572 RepID=A0A5D3F6D9_9ACTN|nr:TIGR02611 family protein [Actinomadura decatromicini]TYK44587.1 TIGR02611 family protein [Actinomadura decatromicini]
MAISDKKEAQPDEEGRFHRFRARLRRNPLLNTAWRAGVFAVGATVLIGGLVMMVTPGPGLLGIVIGLAILATEFAWAQRALHRAKTAADRAKEKAFDPRKRRRNLILGTTTAVLAAAAVAAYLAIYGFVVPWNIEDPAFWT